MVDASGAIQRIIERPDDESTEEDDRLFRAIALSMTSPVPKSEPLPAPKAKRTVRFNLPLLEPPRYTPLDRYP